LKRTSNFGVNNTRARCGMDIADSYLWW